MAHAVLAATVTAVHVAKAIVAHAVKVAGPKMELDVAREMLMATVVLAAKKAVDLVAKVTADAALDQVSVDHHAMATCKVVVVPAGLHKWAKYCQRSCKST
jgi:hypothetical protein